MTTIDVSPKTLQRLRVRKAVWQVRSYAELIEEMLDRTEKARRGSK